MLHESFIQHITASRLFSKRDKLLLAVSGGVDSVVLCELCKQHQFNYSIAHVNFGLRGEESIADENFVKSLGSSHGVELHVARLNAASFAEEKKVSIQVAARELRYEWFNTLATAEGSLIITAHHADDNIETMLMNFFRGTGIRGLRGIPAQSGRLRRPLLPFTKDQILSFAQHESLAWREDSTNATNKYSRNYFRNLVIPAVASIYPEAEQNLRENIVRFSEVEMLYKQAIEKHRSSLAEVKGNELHIPVLKLKKSEPVSTILYELAKPFGFTPSQLNDLTHLLYAEHGKTVYSPTHRVIRNRDWLIFTPREAMDSDNIVVEEGDEQVVFKGGLLKLWRKDLKKKVAAKHDSSELLDASVLEYPLILRRWKAGDYFYPLGMTKKKKIARFLIDLKLSRTEKENTWVIESGKRICCVLGKRIDDRFKIQEHTRHVLEITYTRE